MLSATISGMVGLRWPPRSCGKTSILSSVIAASLWLCHGHTVRITRRPRVTGRCLTRWRARRRRAERSRHQGGQGYPRQQGTRQGVGSGYVQKVVTSRETLKHGASASKVHLAGHRNPFHMPFKGHDFLTTVVGPVSGHL